MNIDIFYFFYNLSKIPFISKFAVFLSYPFTYGVLILIFIWAFFFSNRKFFNTSMIFISGFFAWLTGEVIKNILKVNRPFVDLSINPLHPETGFSFPSNHTALFTAIAVSFFLIDKRLGYLFSLIALLIGLSRIIIGVHYPVDVIGGVIVGIVIGLIFREIYKKI